MTIWLDAQLPPTVAPWIAASFGVDCQAVRDLELLRSHGPPPSVLWVTCGNTSNARLRAVLTQVLPAALRLVAQGESLVEIGEGQPAPPPGPGPSG